MKHILVGVVSLGLGIWGLASWFSTFGLVMRGVVPFLLLLFGLVALYSGLRASSTQPSGRGRSDEDEDDEDDELDDLEDDEDEDEDEDEYAA